MLDELACKITHACTSSSHCHEQLEFMFILFLDFASSRLARWLNPNASSNESRSRDCPLQSEEWMHVLMLKNNWPCQFYVRLLTLCFPLYVSRWVDLKGNEQSVVTWRTKNHISGVDRKSKTLSRVRSNRHLRKSQNTVHHPIELLVHHPKRQFVLKSIHRKES